MTYDKCSRTKRLCNLRLQRFVQTLSGRPSTFQLCRTTLSHSCIIIIIIIIIIITISHHHHHTTRSISSLILILKLSNQLHAYNLTGQSFRSHGHGRRLPQPGQLMTKEELQGYHNNNIKHRRQPHIVGAELITTWMSFLSPNQ